MRSLIDRITRLSMRFRWITIIITLVAIGFGAYSFTQLNQELLPDIDFPQTFTVAQNGGANSDNVLHMYAIPFEERVEKVDGVVNVETTSRDGFFIGIARNEFGLDQDSITSDIRKEVDAINNDLPLRRIEPQAGSNPRQMIGELSPEAVLWLDGYATANNQLGFKQQLSQDVWLSFSIETLRAIPTDVFNTLEADLRKELLARRGAVSPEPTVPVWDRNAPPPALPFSWNVADGRITDTSDLAEIAQVRSLSDLFNNFIEDGYIIGALGNTKDVTVNDIDKILRIEASCRSFYDGVDPGVCSFVNNYLLADGNGVQIVSALPLDSYNALVASGNYPNLPPHNPEAAASGLSLPSAWRVEPIEVVTFTFSDIPLASISMSLDDAGLQAYQRERTELYLANLAVNGYLAIPDGTAPDVYIFNNIDNQAIPLLPTENTPETLVAYLNSLITNGIFTLPNRNFGIDGVALAPNTQDAAIYLGNLAELGILDPDPAFTSAFYLRRLANNDLIPRLKDLEDVANVTLVGGDEVETIPVGVAIAELPTELNGNGNGQAPALPLIWQNFLRLQDAQQLIFVAESDPTTGGVADFLNGLALDPSGLSQNLLRTLSAETWYYLAENNAQGNDVFWDSLQPAVYQSMSLEAVAKLPEAQVVIPEIYSIPAEPITRIDNNDSLQVVIFKEQEANTVVAWQETDEFLDKWSEENNVSIFVAFEQASFIEESINGVTNDGLLGALFATVIILIFMNLSIRSTMVTAVSIPGSVMIALILMNIIPPNVNSFLAPILDDVGRDTFFGSILEFIIRLFPASYTLNIMTLSGLTVAIGRVVDDSIVVLENIYRNVQHGEEQHEAILHGTREVSIAILAATITTMFVFLPLGLFGGVIGAFFLPFGLAVVYSLVGSYAVAVTTVPALASFLITKESMPEEGLIPLTDNMGAYERGLNQTKNVLIGSIGGLSTSYARLISFLLRTTFNRVMTIVAALLTLFFGLYLLSQRPQTFLPDFGEPTITIQVELPAVTQGAEGYEVVSMQETTNVVNDIEIYLLNDAKDEGVQNVVSSIGGDSQQFDARTDSVQPTNAVIRVSMASSEERDALVETLREQVRTILIARGYPESSIDDYFNVSGSSLAGGFGGFALEITPDNGQEDVRLADLRAYNDVIVGTLNGIDGVVNLNSSLTGAGSGESTYVRIDGIPAIQYTAELESDDTLGLTLEAIADTDEAVQDFKKVQESLVYNIRDAALNINDGSTAYNQTVLVSIDLPSAFETEYLPIDRAQRIADQIEIFAQAENTTTKVYSNEREVAAFENPTDAFTTLAVVEVNFASSEEAQVAVPEIAAYADEQLSKPTPKVTIGQGFDSEQQQEGFAQIGISMGIATIIVYVILALTFGNLIHPVTILVSLPLAVVGAAVGLTITGRVLSLSSMIGLLMLIGIVVSNAVVLLDRVQQNRRDKNMSVRDALVEAGGVRLRPILMTATTTIFGVFPLALGLTEGAIIAAELGTVVIGGLVSSTILTLIVVPVVYSLFADLMTLIGGLFARENAKPTPTASAGD